MYFSDLFMENLDECNKIISYGNKKGWDATEPYEVWEKRYYEAEK